MSVRIKCHYWPVLFGLTACQGGPNIISQRDFGPSMAETKVVSPNPQASVMPPPNDLFMRHKDVKIRHKAPVNESGSLTDLKDPRSYLYGFEHPVSVGNFLDVKLASNRNDAPEAESPGATKDDGGKGKPKKPIIEESALLKALPELEPGGKNKPVLVKTIKMQVLEQYENGDVQVMYRRRSLRDGQGVELMVSGRVPAEALARTDAISTADLADVDWKESANGEIVERKSANWEDEYSLRLSGFDEAKSKEAYSLEEKREQLKSTRDKLENEIKAFGSERNSMTKERAKLLDQKSKDNAKMAELEKKNSELEKKVDDLTPKEKDKDDSTDDTEKNADAAAGKQAPKSAAKVTGGKAANPTGNAAANVPSKAPASTTTPPAASPTSPAGAGSKSSGG